VAFKCRGPKGTTSYEQGILGWSPGYSSPRRALPYAAEKCAVTSATVQAAPEMGE
jgi:hypothetical protein